MIQIIHDQMLTNLQKLREEINAFQNESRLWHFEKNIANSAGNLCLHLVGNLNTFIGVALGNTNYVRNRELEFSQKDLPKKELLQKVDDTIKVVSATLKNLDPEKLKTNFPIKFYEKDVSTEYMLIHLVSHLTYHLGQINYHRRLLDTN